MPDVLDRLTTALADRYRIERELGRGGMAIVYLAHDLKQGRQVAVKVVQPDLAAAIGGERFLNEIKVTANLQHPHILPLFDSGETDGFLYYVMPYVKGESLRALLDRKKQLPIDRAIEITKAVGSALGHAHRQGIIHRDIKPENILLADDGTALVADFGIALAVNEAGGTRLTETGMSLGTAEYMSPEQATGDRQLDPASDIYSLGAVLYEMLTGDPPHTGNTAQAIIARLMMEQPTSIRLLRETVPEHLEQTVMKALAKVPADRFDSAEAMVLQLAALATPSGGITSTETRLPATASRFNFRNPVMLVVGALLALAVALGLWQGLGGRRGGDSDTALDPNLVAVMPFRTAGADPSLAYLREGMMDLLAAKLTGEGGPRAADPRTVLAAWRRVASADGADVSEEQAADVARTIGAGQLLLGSVVGSPSRLVLSATLTSAGTTSPGATQASVQGPEDSLHVAGGLLDQLTGELLAGDAGVRGEFGGSLTTSSLEALKAYLDGQVAFRGSQFDEAAQHLSRAIGADSSFALAAFLLVRTAGWLASPVTGYVRVREIAWDGRNRLGPRDRTLLEAYLGPRGNMANRADVLEARERAVIAMPDQADAWFLLGDAYFHEGFRVGGPDARERAVQAFERTVALDSTWAAPLQHLLEAATRGRDTMEIRRLWELLVRLDSTSTDNDGLRFYVAVRLGNEEMIEEALDRLAGQWGPAALATVFAQRYRVGVQYLDTLTAIMQSNALTQRERNGAARHGYIAAMNRGRPREALGLRIRPVDPEQYLETVLYWNGLLEDIELVLQRADSTARAPFGPTAAEQRGQLVTACRLAWWRLARGETGGVPFLLQRLEAGLIMGDSVVPDGASPHCTSMVRAMLAVRRGQADAMALVERVDSILLSYSPRRDYPIGFNVSYFTVAALFEELGEPERALEWVRRVGGEGVWFLSTKLREEGRLAALTGDRERAISAYGHYLELRSDPEPEVLPEVEAVRDELARLVGEPE